MTANAQQGKNGTIGWRTGAGRALLVLAALVLGGLACNAVQASGRSLFSAADGSQTVEELAGAASELLDRWEDRPAFYVVMAALDNGYSADQVIEHTAIVAPDGTIAGIEPAGPPLGLLSPTGPGGEGPPGEAAIGAAARIVPAPRRQAETPADQYVEDVDSWLSELWEAGQESIRQQEREEAAGLDDERLEESVAFLTLELAGRGYSGDQIVDAILLSSVAYQEDAPFGCIYIQGPDGNLVTPANEPIDALAQSCQPLEADPEAPEPVEDESTEEPARAPDQDGDEPWIAVVEGSKRIEGECRGLFDTSKEGNFCPVSIHVTVEYGGVGSDTRLVCTDVQQQPIGEEMMVADSGIVRLDKFFEDPVNRTLFEGYVVFAKCVLRAGDDQLALDTLAAEDVPWVDAE